jgi:hypothetical protein
MKPICVTFAWGKYRTWDVLYKNCIASFKKWHPDIEMRVVTDEDFPLKEISNFSISMARFEYTKKLFDEGYTKVISIGLDTFACARWDEILEDNKTPLLATLGGPYCLDPDIKLKYIFMPQHNWYENMTINADLTCYNCKEVIYDLEKIMMKYKRHDNHAIDLYVNEVNPDACRVVDWPYVFSKFVYNGRAGWFGLLSPDHCVNEDGTVRWGIGGPVIGEFSATTRFKPIGNKLYNHVGKHVKALAFDKTYNKNNLSTYLNEETIQWFKDHCDVDMHL